MFHIKHPSLCQSHLKVKDLNQMKIQNKKKVQNKNRDQEVERNHKQETLPITQIIIAIVDLIIEMLMRMEATGIEEIGEIGEIGEIEGTEETEETEEREIRDIEKLINNMKITMTHFIKIKHIEKQSFALN